MFLRVSVCPRGGSTPAGKHRPSPPRAGTPGEVHPLWAVTPLGRYTPHRPQCMLGYEQQAGGTHPIGMHSCYECITSYVCEEPLLTDKKMFTLYNQI